MKSKCTLAAFCCTLRAAEHGLYLSDNHFYNFGVKITSDATEHTVVIIDAGSRGLDPYLWTKSGINTKIMKRFWQYAEKEGGPNLLLQSKWRELHCWRQCLKWATREWERSPILTTTPISTHDLRHLFSATECDDIEHINQSNQYKILRMIGSFACAGQWSDDLDRACYRAARQFHVDLSSDEMDVIEELHSRITRGPRWRTNNAVLATWFELQSYRESYMRRNGQQDDRNLRGSIRQEIYSRLVPSVEEVRSIREEYYWYTLWDL